VHSSGSREKEEVGGISRVKTQEPVYWRLPKEGWRAVSRTGRREGVGMGSAKIRRRCPHRGERTEGENQAIKVVGRMGDEEFLTKGAEPVLKQREGGVS